GPATGPASRPSGAELIETLRDRAGWDRVAADGDAAGQAASAARIVARARAADGLLDRGDRSPAALAALADCARHRSLHRQWMYHGLDGATALHALIRLRAPDALAVAREAVWGRDPALAAVRDERYDVPPAWGD